MDDELDPLAKSDGQERQYAFQATIVFRATSYQDASKRAVSFQEAVDGYFDIERLTIVHEPECLDA